MVAEIELPYFFANWSDLQNEEYLRFVYHFEPLIDPRRAAASLCAEQSTAMWRRNGVQEDLRDLHGAKVVSLSRLASGNPNGREWWEVVVAHPHRNFGPKLPNLLVAACGEGGFYSPGIGTIKLIDIKFSNSYLRNFSGPQFGIDNLRERYNIYARPFFIGVVKPNLGLTPADFAELAADAWQGGLDIAKDDEMQANAEWSPIVERIRAVVSAREKIHNKYDSTSQSRKAFITNITDEVEHMPQLLREAENAGADMVMINPVWTGISALRQLRAHSQVPIMGHFAGAATLSREPHFGISSQLLSKLMRIAGADLVGIAGFGERMHSTPEDVLANINACLEPLPGIAPSLPIPGGSDNADTLAKVYAQIGHADFGFIAGRGVFGHVHGPREGAASIVEAWNNVSK